MLDDGVATEQDFLFAFVNAAATGRVSGCVDYLEMIPFPLKLRAIFKNKHIIQGIAQLTKRGKSFPDLLLFF